MASRSPGEDGTTAVKPDAPSPGRKQTRQRVIEAAIDLLTRGGRDAVTTRAVADAAGLQPPAIYRLFGDKDGLLDAVAEYGFAAFIATKHVDPDPAGPHRGPESGLGRRDRVRSGQPRAVHADVHRTRRTASAAFKTGMEILMARVRRLAAGGWLRVDEELAAQVIHATARGAVLTWLSLPQDRRNPALLTTLRESMVATVTNQQPAVRDAGPAGAARALRAALPEQTTSAAPSNTC